MCLLLTTEVFIQICHGQMTGVCINQHDASNKLAMLVYDSCCMVNERTELAFTCQPGKLDKRTKHVLVHVNCSNQRLLCNCDPTRSQFAYNKQALLGHHLA
ncbi:hypothetical protein T4D_15751 [Trichinella pseudospiralis]|uniref:Uncharacterized protein n=1 Tax=Trichinella pseudospiralis TaxID=6337 RepID=A0A0V1F9R6_TRIPS|nr:hypothetical protein T4D_15751 [Trichinella pseudospiralis]